MKTIANLVSALIFCSLGVFSANPGLRAEMVWCIGQDGHLEIEYAEVGRCVDRLARDGRQSFPSRVAKQAFADHCGTCVDIRLANPKFQAHQVTKFTKSFKTSSIAAINLNASNWHGRAPFWKRPWPVKHGAPVSTFLRTIRLII